MVSRFSLCLQQPLPWGYCREGLGPFEVTQLATSGGCPAQRALVAVLLALVRCQEGGQSAEMKGRETWCLPLPHFMDMSHQRRLDGVTLRGERENTQGPSLLPALRLSFWHEYVTSDIKCTCLIKVRVGWGGEEKNCMPLKALVACLCPHEVF